MANHHRPATPAVTELLTFCDSSDQVLLTDFRGRISCDAGASPCMEEARTELPIVGSVEQHPWSSRSVRWKRTAAKRRVATTSMRNTTESYEMSIGMQSIWIASRGLNPAYNELASRN